MISTQNVVDVHVLFVPLTYEKSVCDSSELTNVGTWKSNEKRKVWYKLGLTKKLFIDAAMKVPCSTLWTRTKVSTLKYRLHVRQACSVHCKGIVRLDSSESFWP